MNSTQPHRIEREEGQAMVEFALVLPVLAMLLLGIAQFGIAFNHYLTLTDAVRAGARQAAVSRFVADPLTATKNRVTGAAAGLVTADIATTVTAADGKAPPSWTPGSDVRVTAKYPYAINLLGLVVASGRLSSSTVERVE
jgi:Flp pilus assembly protein TadG